MFAVGSTLRQRQNLRVRLWFFARIQTRASFLWRSDGVHIFSKREDHSLPNHIDSGDRPPPTKALKEVKISNHRFRGPEGARYPVCEPGCVCRFAYRNSSKKICEICGKKILFDLPANLQNLVGIHVDRDMHALRKGQLIDD